MKSCWLPCLWLSWLQNPQNTIGGRLFTYNFGATLLFSATKNVFLINLTMESSTCVKTPQEMRDPGSVLVLLGQRPATEKVPGGQ